MSSYPNGMVPQLSPQIAKDLAAQQAAAEDYKFDCAEIQRLAAALSSMKNPMFGVQEVMSAVMGMSGDQISSLSALDNLDTDMRNLLQGAQSGYNQIDGGDDANPTPQQVQGAQAIVDNINALENFVQWQQSLGKDSVFDQGTLTNMETAIQSIKGAFQDGTSTDWGNATVMAMTILNNINGKGGSGSYSPFLKTITDGFQTINQSTSALSTTTNTQLQFQTEQYKQYLGIDQSSIQAYLKLTSAMIQNEKTS